ncbi:medium-chain acyl-CoA ligase ACSF2, mitochondrial [Nematostella vectensis]|uniref:medium-chain acyl-CoA ligase ACSF2, mitochondrial n=1 Tax=Nematostella vectensis TaxID=45351 RepID=UPI0020779250|nr:medium-chain acyl-CoA ligase ACSF2, mitochondrial [Nematostella vectensis]
MMSPNLSYIHVPHACPMDSRLLHQYLDIRAEQNAGTEAVVMYNMQMSRSTMTYAQWRNRSVSLAASLLELGVSRGQHVLLIGGNTLEYIVFLMALHRIGALAILLGPGDLTPANTALLKTLDCTAIAFNPVMKESQERQLWTGLKELTDKKTNIIFFGNFNLAPSFLTATKIHLYDDLLKRGELLGVEDVLTVQAQVQGDDPIVALATSGTTGIPKFVQHTSHAIVNVKGGEPSTDSSKMSRGKIISFVDRPVSWIGGLTPFYNSLYSESTVVWIPTEIGLSNNPDISCEVIQREKVISWSPSPSLIPRLQELQSKYDLSNVKIIVMAGQALTADDLWSVIEAFPAAYIFQGYASSEGLKISFRLLNKDIQEKSSVAKMQVFAGVEVKIVDTDGKVVPRGQPGEICCRSECVFLGYLGNPEATSRVKSPQGWLHTEDLGTMDDQDMIEVTGRKSEIIKRATVKIFPGEIRAELVKNPIVADTIVIGVPDKMLHEEICACVVLRKNACDDVPLDALADWCNGKWPPRADGLSLKPKYFVVFDEFPMTRSAKLDLHGIKKIALGKLGLEGK